MLKPAYLLLFFFTLAGCQSLLRPADYDSLHVGFRCMGLAGIEPFNRGNLPVVIVPIEPLPEGPPECVPAGAQVRKRTLFWWLLGVGAVIALTCGGWWWV